MSDGPMHENDHELAAAYALGALEPAARARFERHLDECDRCQADIVDFAPIPGLLRGVDPGELAARPIDVSDQVVEAVRRQRARSLTGRERWLAAIAAVAVMVATGAIVVAIVRGSDEAPTFGGPPVELAIDESSGVTGLVTVSERGWGTRVEIDLFDMPARERYLLWAVGKDGTWDVSASWALSPDGTCRVVGASRLQPDEIERFVITSDDQADELVSAFST